MDQALMCPCCRLIKKTIGAQLLHNYTHISPQNIPHFQPPASSGKRPEVTFPLRSAKSQIPDSIFLQLSYISVSSLPLHSPGEGDGSQFSNTEQAGPWSHFWNTTNVLCQLLFWGRTKDTFLSFFFPPDGEKQDPFLNSVSLLWH